MISFCSLFVQRKEKDREAMLSAVAAADLNERSRLDRVFAGMLHFLHFAPFI
jgi:hypothetical protein